MTTIEVSDLFTSIQGEGPRAGTPSVFLRTRRCNLACSWCDTRYTWDPNDLGYQAYETLDVEAIASRIQTWASLGVHPSMLARWAQYAEPVAADTPTSNLVITGGEPMIWKHQLAELLPLIEGGISSIEIETNGVIAPLEGHDYQLVHYNVSPKLPTSGNGKRTTWREPAIVAHMCNPNSFFKFVVTDLDGGDEAWIREIVGWMVTGGGVPRQRVYLMPEGTTPEQLGRHRIGVRDLADDMGIEFSDRGHVYAFGDKRGT